MIPFLVAFLGLSVLLADMSDFCRKNRADTRLILRYGLSWNGFTRDFWRSSKAWLGLFLLLVAPFIYAAALH